MRAPSPGAAAALSAFLRLAAPTVAALVLGAGCSAEEGVTPGQLTLALTTNMVPGVDFDVLRLVVKRDGVVLQDLPYTWPRGGVGESPVRFPATYAIVNRTGGAPTVTVRIEALQQQRVRIVRDAVTTLPTSGQFVLPILLDWACLDKIPAASPTDVQCAENQTCIAGACTTPTVDAGALSTFDLAQVFGGGTGTGGSGTCFDVLGTYNGSTTYAPGNLGGPCGVTWSGSDANLNVAVALPAGSAGFCYTSGVGGCFVPLEKGGASGWSLANGRLTVPERVCSTAGAKVAVVEGKPTKAANQPPCGSFSSVGSPDAGTGPTAIIVVTEADAGAPPQDASAADATLADAGPSGTDAASDANAAEASASDSGAPDAGETCSAAGDCTRVPPSVCASATSVTTYAGECASLRCVYTASTTACAAASCTGGVATTASTCSNGACQAGTPTTCSFGCSGAVCAADPCATATCSTPPSTTCANGTTRRTYAATGTCSSATGSAVCSYAPTDTACPSGQTCSAGVCVVAGTETGATTAGMTGAGLSDCGASTNDVCARSLLVSGGTFNRGTDTSNPATVSDFRLDKYEVTVGRFRKFVDAWVGGWRPPVASGKHTHLNGGNGLANTAGGNEPGWDATWTGYVGAPSFGGVAPTEAGATTKAAWDTNLNCSATYATWTSASGSNEKRPMNCLTWYDLNAFCVWDGGFLPSEPEWEYATAGGSEERTYAWGNAAPGANTALAIYGCYYNGTGSGSCSGVTNIAPVGTGAAGAGKWGQLDLAGNVWEWNLDWYQSSHVSTCNNCTNLTPSSLRVIRGGSFSSSASYLPAAYRADSQAPAFRSIGYGGRCARTPSGGTCTAESDAAFCTRLGATCGSKTGTDNCGQARTVADCGACNTGYTCMAANRCEWNALLATTAGMVGDGLGNCGPSGNEICAYSPLVDGGTFYRGTDTANPATIASFRLDKYEVTVGRFRKFVDAWVGGWRPTAGSGKHTHLNGGSGLVKTVGGNEPGWNASWTSYVGAPSESAAAPTGAGATTKAAWDTNLNCNAGYATWTSAVGANERRPINCLSWYDLHAFCIWDGGFLPSEAEWEYAAAGGSDERTYPWGNTVPSANTSLAIYGCYYNGSGPGSCSDATNIAPVGSAAAGAGKWEQVDLAGNVWEWTLDVHQAAFAPSCVNCTNLSAGSSRVNRGGSFRGTSDLAAAGRINTAPASRGFDSLGGRCARLP